MLYGCMIGARPGETVVTGQPAPGKLVPFG